MLKKKSNKVFAALLCATTVAAFYGSPVMAAGDDWGYPGQQDSYVPANLHVAKDAFVKGSLIIQDGEGHAKTIIASNGIATNGNLSVKGNFTLDGTVNGATITADSFNGVNVKNLQGEVVKVKENTAGISHDKYGTTIEGKVTVNGLGYIHTPGQIWADAGLTVGRDGDGMLSVSNKGNLNIANAKHENTFHVDAATGNVTASGTVNEVKLAKDGIKFGNVEIASTPSGTAIKGDVIVGNSLSTFGDLHVGLGDKFAVDATTGNVTGGLYNGVDVEKVAYNTSAITRENGVTKIGNLVEVQDYGAVHITNGKTGAELKSAQLDYEGLTIQGQTLTADKIAAIDKMGDGLASVNKNVAGIERTSKTVGEGIFATEEYTTTIEGVLAVDKAGAKVGDKFAVDAATGNVTGGLYNGVDVKAVADNTAGIVRKDGKTTIEGALNVSEDEFNLGYGDNTLTVNNTGINFAGNVNLGSNASFQYGDSSIKLNDFYKDYQDHLTAFEENNNKLEGQLNDLKGEIGNVKEDLGTVQDKTQNITADENGTHFKGDVTVDGNLTVGDVNGGNISGGNIEANKGTIGGVAMADGNITANKGTIGGVAMADGSITTGNTTVNRDGVTVGNTTVNKDGVTVGNTTVTDKDVVINKGQKDEVSLSDTADRVGKLEENFGHGIADVNNRINQVDEKINKVGAMAAAIANLRTMGYDPTAPTEIAVAVGQYRDETGAALGFFHYPNKNFMLSLSVSTSGDEVMGGVGATWKFGHKSSNHEEKVANVKEVKAAKADALKQSAREARVAAQQKRHAEMAAARAK